MQWKLSGGLDEILQRNFEGQPVSPRHRGVAGNEHLRNGSLNWQIPRALRVLASAAVRALSPRGEVWIHC
jgi:hypothetical protein